jgi:hypothetical protein
MKAVEFCYWLQGYFEISGAHNSSAFQMDERQVDCVRRHLGLVKKVEPNHGNAFVKWLDLLLRHAKALSTEDVFEVQRALSTQFLHVIDPSYDFYQKALNAVHGNGDAAGGALVRC